MPQEIIIINSKYSFYKKEIKRTDFLKILKDIEKRNKNTTCYDPENFKELENIVEPISIELFKKTILDELSILVHDYDQRYGYHHLWFQEQVSIVDRHLNYSDENNNIDYIEMLMIVGRKDKTKVFNISIKGFV